MIKETAGFVVEGFVVEDTEAGDGVFGDVVKDTDAAVKAFVDGNVRDFHVEARERRQDEFADIFVEDVSFEIFFPGRNHHEFGVARGSKL